MALELEVNVVHFPIEKPYMCQDPDNDEVWNDEIKKAMYHAESQIHLIKFGPITEEFLTRKKVGWSKVDFGMEFKLTDDGNYKWFSGDSDFENNSLPMYQLYKLLDVLKTIGYENERSHMDYETGKPVTKHLIQLTKKF